MKTTKIVLFVSAFLASIVEGVEALTVVLATGTTRGWRSTLIGAGAALLALAVVIALLGPALAYVPLDVLRVIVGGLLLVFGLQWLRKAILRAGGYIAMRDEEAIYRAQLVAAQTANPKQGPGIDWYAFTLAFKSVFLEGFEVAFIVITFGGAQGNIPLAALGALGALIVVVITGAVLKEPLERIPENTIKFGVGVLLSTFGLFWSAEGLGVAWPGSDLAILGILAFMTLISVGFVVVLRDRYAHARLKEQFPTNQEAKT
jgi:uncharacterized membrane protein